MPGPNYFIISTDGSITNTNLVSSDYSYSPDWCVENYTQNTISATSDDKRYILYNHSSSHTDWCTWNSAPSDSNTYLRDMLTGTDTVVTGI